jgi:FAD:protein FMN transferase
MKHRVILTCLLMISSVAAFSEGKEEERFSATHFAMGTVCTITLYGNDDTKAFQGAFALIDELESKMSVSKSGSEVAAINAAAGIAPVKVSAETFFVIEQSLEYMEISGGKFDVTVQPLVELWGIGTGPPRVPGKTDIDAAVALIGAGDVELNYQNSTIYLKRSGMAVDLGGIAKGYAADRVEEYLIDYGHNKGILNFGGNIIMFGAKPGGDPWVIGIQDPFDSRGTPIGTVKLPAGSVVTSGIYERYFEQGGRRYHHILDPETGYPVENELVSISIIGDSGIVADAFSTLIFALGVTKGAEILESIPSLDGVFITKELDVHTTSGIKDRFSISNPDYHFKPLKP